jgi:hypothetical protein
LSPIFMRNFKISFKFGDAFLHSCRFFILGKYRF